MQNSIEPNDVAPTQVAYPVIEAERKLYLAQRDSARREVARLRAALWSWRGILVDAKTVARYWTPKRREWIDQRANGNGGEEEIMHLGFDLIIKITEALASAAGEAVQS